MRTKSDALAALMAVKVSIFITNEATLKDMKDIMNQYLDEVIEYLKETKDEDEQ